MLKRDKEIKIRFTESELYSLNRKCEKIKLKREEYVREIIAEKLAKNYVSREDTVAELKLLIEKMNKVGKDISDIARMIHTEGVIPDDVINRILSMQRILFDEMRKFKSIK